MDDFLQSLRNNPMEKQSTVTRRNYNLANDKSNYMFGAKTMYHKNGNRNLSRQSQFHQKSNQMPIDEPSSSPLQDAITGLCSNVEFLAENQKYLITAREKTAALMERQVIAIERVLDLLNISLK